MYHILPTEIASLYSDRLVLKVVIYFSSMVFHNPKCSLDYRYVFGVLLFSVTF